MAIEIRIPRDRSHLFGSEMSRCRDADDVAISQSYADLLRRGKPMLATTVYQQGSTPDRCLVLTQQFAQ